MTRVAVVTLAPQHLLINSQLAMPTFNPGDFVVHVTGGPVHVVKFLTSNEEYYCERWSDAGFLRENFTPATLRPATQAEIDLLKKQF